MTQPTARADILGKLLLIQETIDVLPDTSAIAAFLRRALIEIPGITDIHLCVDGAVFPPSAEFEEACADCDSPGNSSQACIDHAIGNYLLTFVPLRSARHLYGKLILSIHDKEAFSPYGAFLRNISNVVAATLETRDYFRQIEEAKAGLEAQVIARTARLTASETSLRESEERWKFALEGAGDGVWDWNPQTDKATFSKRWEGIIGYAEHEFPNTGAAWVEHLHPEDKDRVLSAIREYFAGGSESYVVEFRMRCKDSSWKWILARGMLIGRDANGNPQRMIGTHTDITERKRTDQALRKSESTYRSLFDNMLNGVAHYRMVFRDSIPVDYEFIAVNPAFVQTTGLKDVVGKKVSEVIPGYVEANPDSLQVFGRVAQTGEPARWEHNLAELGKWFSFSIYSPAQGEFVVVSDDITARKHSELALQESEDRFRSIFNNAIDGILLADAVTRKFMLSNPSIQRMLGYTAEEILDIRVDDIHPAEEWPRILAGFNKQLAGELTLAPDLPVKRKDGSVFYADINAAPMTIGGKAYMMGMFRDITERKKTENSLRLAATVFENSHDGVLITDIDGHILTVNSSFLKITGYTEAEVLGKNPNILHSGRQTKDFYQSMWAKIKAEGFWQGEIWNRRKNGETYPEWLTISGVRNDRGETTNYVGVFSDLSQLKQSQIQLERLAHYDPLTSLPNRLLLQSHLAHALAHAQRRLLQVGVLYLDLDRFKNINESLGYPAGDELLVNLTERLSMHMRSEDMLARLGGDEFLLVLEHINSPEDAAVVARSLLEVLSQPFVLPGGQEIFIGASIGISVFPNDGDNAEQMIQHADAAMHQAKKQGRNTYRFYTDALTRSAGEHLELESRLRHAIGANQLRVYYQPQINIASGQIVGAEALVRWQDPERGLIPPVNFIQLAEETGLIGSIGEWVLKETCLQGKRWIDAGLPFLTLAVNLSPHQFMRGNIVELVSKVLAETGFPADRLELELTESALMEQEEDAVKMLHLLRAQDIRLAIDDFGTGYSSLAYLKRFPLDILKIDKSFVDDIPFHQDDMEIAATIIAMGHILGFKVLAEGVETAEQLAFLEDKGCDMYQGYLTSPPVPADTFEKMLAERMHK